MNFAEAALLIQGSTCVYSKKVGMPHTRLFIMLLTYCVKVEYLYGLVYQTLDLIASKR